MKYIDQVSEYITLEFTILALSIGFALTFMMALSAMKTRRQIPNKPLIQHGDSSELINNLQQQLTQVQTELADNKNQIESLEKKLPRTSLVRFNPFRDSGVGGNQSFSLAQVDTYGNGSLVTHLFSREMSRVSAKRIINWESEQELSPEEKQALNETKNRT